MNQPKSPFLNVYYVLDPMCSWCWAFRNSWLALQEKLPETATVRYVLGGLAPDSDQPMPESMQQGLQQTWKAIEQRTGTTFNHDFWTLNQPRRSTYPACRAVIAASRIQPGCLSDMVFAIQKAYYLDAKNPSNPDTLCDCAESIGLDRARFESELNSAVVAQDFQNNLNLVQKMGVQGFPAVIAVSQSVEEEKPAYYLITAGYCDPETLVANWQRQISMTE